MASALSLDLSAALPQSPPPVVTSPRDRSFSFVGSDLSGPRSPRSADSAQLPRAASYSYIPHVKDTMFEESTVLELKRRITEEESQAAPISVDEEESDASSGASTPEQEAPKPLEMNRRPSASRRGSRLSSIFNSKPAPEKNAAPESNPLPRSKTVSSEVSVSPRRSLTRLRPKSWYSSSSRSSSPTKAGAKSEKKKDNTETPTPRSSWSFGAGRRKSLASTSPEKTTSTNEEPTSSSSSVRRKGTVLAKKAPKRPLNVVLKGPNPGEISTTPSPRHSPLSSPSISQENVASLYDLPTSPLPKSFSTDRLPSFVRAQKSMERIPPLPRRVSSNNLRVPKADIPRKRDELWSVFRELDATHQKFQAKSIALKPNVVRTGLLPFLREYASHPSNIKLRAEDLDRRANILNKWWTGLLDALGGKNNQSVTGTDRYAILDGIVGIMERPEWRTMPSLRPVATKGFTPPTMLKSVSSTSLASTSSDFLVESVQHNVRNIFIENLLAQMSYIVDHMSLRQAPASLVSFAGKTCAYAFFFCPGVADILVRLWNPSIDIIRRVVEEFGVSRTARLEISAKVLMEGFPTELNSLAFISLGRLSKELRKPAPVHVRTANFNWHGPWLKRWCGKESDLFYVFVKHYHVLLHEFLPADAIMEEKVCAPGLVMVQAQILANMDATIHRHANPHDDPMRLASDVTFDDLLDPDATAAPLPMSPANATRLMPQNRLIMLLREFLSDNSAKFPEARHMFAESFVHLLKACVRRVSLYDSPATYTLCDLLEEAFDIIMRYENSSSPRHDVLDWPFWITVWKKMVESHNTSTEIKLYSFLYSLWTKVCGDEARKFETCLEFLLESDFFESRFNHWCPMVRAYYMRLLCWRVARFDGEAGQYDVDILGKLQEGLATVWSYYLHAREESEGVDALPPSTAPCPPAPGRRLLIIRTDAPMSPAISPLISFDPLGNRNPSRNGSSSGVNGISRPTSSLSTDSADSSVDEPTSKSKWSLLGKVISIAKAKPKTDVIVERPSTRASVASTASTASNATTASAATASTSTSTASNSDSTPNTTRATPPQSIGGIPPPTHQTFCFRFSLEYTARNRHHPNHPSKHPQNKASIPINNHPPNYRLEPPRLPASAQLFLQSAGRGFPADRSTKPEGKEAISHARYAGRALAEWQDVVNEYQNFFARRKFEGVPRNGLVETPSLGVEGFRRPG